MTREVMMVGSIPLSPAEKVFDTLATHLDGLIRYMPDGEQAGWLPGVWMKLASHPQLEPGRKVPFVRRPTVKIFDRELQYLQLKANVDPDDFDLGRFGIADNALQSFAQFAQQKRAGKIPAPVRFQATVPGPLDCVGLIDAPKAALFRAAEAAINREIDAIVAAIPAGELAIQLDLAVEVELEEFQRRPQAFDLPVFEDKNWSFAEITALIARIANRLPPEVELGFHLCAIWHIDQSQGQDLNVHVDWANALASKIQRPIAYIHMPTVPEHDAADFAPLERLQLQPATRLYLGVIHLDDGIEGARRRVAAAAKHRDDFGVACYCGLGQPSLKEEANPHTLEQILSLHAQAARL